MYKYFVLITDLKYVLYLHLRSAFTLLYAVSPSLAVATNLTKMFLLRIHTINVTLINLVWHFCHL